MAKLIPIAAVALLASLGAASAENRLELARAQSTTAGIAVTNVQADQADTIQVFAYDENGTANRFLGRPPIVAGVNGDVEVALSHPSSAPLRILMSDGNHTVAQMAVEEPLTSPVADLGSLAPAPAGRGPELARAAASVEAAPIEASCVVTSSNGQVVHDSRGGPVTC